MSALFPYYERELTFLRQMAAEFARTHPAAAGRLLLEPTRSADPHVERLIESFALLAARLHHKIDDEFPELTDGLLSVLYPHYLAPMPSCAVIQFAVDAGRGPLPNGFVIPRHSRIVTQPVKDTVCRYQTCYPTTLWPVKVASAKLVSPPFPPGLTPPPQTASALILRLETLTGEPFSNLAMDRLRVHLYGPSFVTGGLYELLFGQALQVLVRAPDARTPTAVRLDPAKVIRPVGFEADEGLIPYPPQSFLGYRLLSEFLAFPAKFFFADLVGLTANRAVAAGKAIEVVIFFDRAMPTVEGAVDAGSFRLGCTPVVNLFEQTAEPIPLTRTKHQYRIVPDVARPLGCEVFSVEGVTGTDMTTGTRTDYRPFYSIRHSPDAPQTYWYSTRTPSTDGDDRGTDVDLALVDLNFRPLQPDDGTLVVRTMCTNRDLPARLQRFGDAMSLGLEGAAPVSGVRAIRSPTLPLRPPARRGRFWRLISHLNLNYLSLTDPTDGGEALREILRLYDAADPAVDPQQAAAVRQLIDGITGVSCRRVPGRVPGVGGGVVRGVEVAVEFDPAKYIDTGGPYLFAAVLDRFFGLYASINSFTRMVAKTRHGEGVHRKWPPRAGEQALI